MPIQNYDDFRHQIMRMADGETGILTSAPVVAFEETGGTVSGAKLIPYTRASLAGFRAAVLPWLANLSKRRPAITRGRAYVSVSPAGRAMKMLGCGLPIGLNSEAAYLGEDLFEPFAAMLAVPPTVGTISDLSAWREETLAALVACEDLSFASVWSPTFFLDLIETLPAAAICITARLDQQAQRRLTCALAGGSIDTTSLWPHLDTISCWADGSSAVWADRLATLCPQAFIEPKGVLATEAAITLPFGTGLASGAVPALTSTFLEFIDANGGARLAHELTAGERYRVVITTAGGLYRYDIGDCLRCLGHTDNIPHLVFEGRSALVSDLVGEKLDEAFVANVLARLPLPAAIVPKREPKPHYELWLDGAGDIAMLAREVEAGLSANPQYAYARRLGQLGDIEPRARPDVFAEQSRARTEAGARLAVLKHRSIIIL